MKALEFKGNGGEYFKILMATLPMREEHLTITQQENNCF